jgi:hypothetical protein
MLVCELFFHGCSMFVVFSHSCCLFVQFKKLSLELGGKNSTIIFADCDFSTTVSGAVRAAFTNQGQVCLAGSRIFVEESIYERFVAAMLEEIKSVSCLAGELRAEQWRLPCENHANFQRADSPPSLFPSFACSFNVATLPLPLSVLCPVWNIEPKSKVMWPWP